MGDTGSDIAALIERCGAIKRGRFELSDGSLIDFYIDKYAFETDPEVLATISDAIVDRLQAGDTAVDVLAGPALGAVPLVTAVSLRLGIPAAYIRLGEKRPVTQARIEGSITKGQRVAILEDVTMTGATITETAEIIEDAGGIVDRLIVVVDRNEGAADRVKEAGYELEWLSRVGEDIEIETADSV
ncbi:MAG: orotate phosphoribosyltransferase [Halobacteriales archaeon]|nr:orotate phosphoribosyltransferase [Halobacteriales archaeon]